MKPCETCWSTLRSAIAARGLEHLVAKGQDEAMVATMQRTEPLMHTLMIAMQLLTSHRTSDVMLSLPPETCPFCLLTEDYLERDDEPVKSKVQLIETLADEVWKDFNKRGLMKAN